jgi:hypothetical protein
MVNLARASKQRPDALQGVSPAVTIRPGARSYVDWGKILAPWRDLAFGTYRPQPRASHEAMVIGISTFEQDRLCTWLPGLLLPFVGKITDCALKHRSSGAQA